MVWKRIRGLFANKAPTELPPAERGADVLVFLGVNHVVVGWARTQRCDLETLWRRCPRADWLIQIALRVDVSTNDLVRIVRRSQIARTVEETTPAWLRGDATNAEWWGAIGHAIDRLVDKHMVGRPLGSVEEHLNTAEIREAFEQEDAAETEIHGELRDLLRAELPYGIIHALIYTSEQSPYR